VKCDCVKCDYVQCYYVNCGYVQCDCVKRGHKKSPKNLHLSQNYLPKLSTCRI
jgi:hypothetical protein